MKYTLASNQWVDAPSVVDLARAMAHATGKGSRARRAAAPNLLLAWDLDTEAIHAILRPGARIEIDPETRAVTVTVAERP